MIKNFEIENYKAFEKASFKIKPITILLGANSIGKSSLMQLILLLKQTINTKVEYKSALRLNGETINLGEPENIFKGFDLNKNVKFSFTIEEKEDIISHEKYFNEIKQQIYFISRDIDRYSYLKINDNKKSIHLKPISQINYKLSFGKRSDSLFDEISENYLSLLEVTKKIKNEKKSIIKKYNSLFIMGDEKLEKVIKSDLKYYSNKIDKINITSLKGIIDFLERIKLISTKSLTYDYTISFDKKNNSLHISEIKILCNNGQVILGYSNRKSKNGRTVYKIISDFINDTLLEKHRIEIARNIQFRSLNVIFSELNTGAYFYNKIIETNDNSFVNFITDVFVNLTKPLQKNFNEELINYVSPLRAFPKRYYFLDEAKIGNSLNTINGDNLAEIIKGNPKVKKQVNDWLQNFGFEVDVDRLRDIIHHLKVKQSGLRLDITDVGFGISQVLPVIVQGFLSKNNSLTLIEQPEIHLHPKMQADLADLFIDIVNTSELTKSILIETHSEYLLKRLRRRISERKISNDDIAIYFIKKEKNKSIITEIEIENFGAFDWPEEFYANELDDTIAFIKNQPANKNESVKS